MLNFRALEESSQTTHGALIELLYIFYINSKGLYYILFNYKIHLLCLNTPSIIYIVNNHIINHQNSKFKYLS